MPVAFALEQKWPLPLIVAIVSKWQGLSLMLPFIIKHHAAVKHGFDFYERTVVACHRYNTFDACDVKVKTATKKV